MTSCWIRDDLGLANGCTKYINFDILPNPQQLEFRSQFNLDIFYNML